MSAYVVSNATINAVCHLLDLDACCLSRGNLGLRLNTDSGVRDRGDIMGDELQALNLAAVRHRYAHRQESFDALPFAWSPIRADLITLVKAAHCWLYQCTEGEQFMQADIYKQVEKACQAVETAIVRGLPEYDAAEWDLEENRHCVRS